MYHRLNVSQLKSLNLVKNVRVRNGQIQVHFSHIPQLNGSVWMVDLSWACARARCTIIMVGKMPFVSVEAINTMRSSNCWCLNKCAKPTRFIASIKCKFFVVFQCKNKDFFPNLKIKWIFKHNYTINVSWNYHKNVIYRLNILSLPKIWLSDSIITLATDWWPKRMTTFFKTPHKKQIYSLIYHNEFITKIKIGVEKVDCIKLQYSLNIFQAKFFSLVENLFGY